jgi:hypothetical protein
LNIVEKLNSNILKAKFEMDGDVYIWALQEGLPRHLKSLLKYYAFEGQPPSP